MRVKISGQDERARKEEQGGGGKGKDKFEVRSSWRQSIQDGGGQHLIFNP